MIDFALLGHPADAAQLYGQVSDLPRQDAASLAAAFESLPPFAVEADLTIGALRGKLIVVPFLPERLDSPKALASASHKTREACQLAKEMGAKIAGLGGFASIAVSAQAESLSQELGIALTSGNSLTAALALEQLHCLLDKLGWSLKEKTVAVLGAGGDIGRACALAIAPQTEETILIGRNRNKLEVLRNELESPRSSTAPYTSLRGTRCAPKQSRFPVSEIPRAFGARNDNSRRSLRADDSYTARHNIRISTDALDAVEADILLAATSAGRAILAESDLRPGTIACDISYPKTFSYSSQPRSDVLIFSGGIAETPFALDIAAYTGLPSPALLHGCFSETIVLAMAGRYESYSIGQGQITAEKMRAILELAQSFGIRPAPPYREEQLIDDAALKSFRRFFTTENTETTEK